MQQLSLFDFGEEAPKPEKKKKTSKDAPGKSGTTPPPVKAPSAEPPAEQQQADAHSRNPDHLSQASADPKEALTEETLQMAAQEDTAEKTEQRTDKAVSDDQKLDHQQLDSPRPNEKTDDDQIEQRPEAVIENNEKAFADEGKDTGVDTVQPAINTQKPENATQDQDIKAKNNLQNNLQASFELHPPQQTEATHVSDDGQQSADVMEPEREPSKDAESTALTSEKEPDIPVEGKATASGSNTGESSATLQDNKDSDGTPKGTVQPDTQVKPSDHESKPQQDHNTEPTDSIEQNQKEEQDQPSGGNPPTSEVVFANEQFGVKVVSRTFTTQGVVTAKMPPPPDENNTENLEVDSDQEAEAARDKMDNADESATSDTKISDQDQDSGLDTSFSPDDFSGSAGQDIKPELNPTTDERKPQEEIISIKHETGIPIPPDVIEASSEDTTEENTENISESPINKEQQGQVEDEKKTAKTVDNPSKDTLSSSEIQSNTDNEDNRPQKPYYVEDQTVPVRKRGRKSFKEIDAEVDLINVPPDEELFQKQYYPISVVAKWFRVNNSLLRFWENEFKILKPRKNKKGDRFFRPEDVKNLQLIYHLLRQKKLTINGAIKHLNAYREQTEVNMQLIQTLNEFKGFLLELRAATEK